MLGAFVFLLQGRSSPSPCAADAPWRGTAPEGWVMLSGELLSREALIEHPLQKTAGKAFGFISIWGGNTL